jgi:small subunit ribosomal protein S7
MSRKNRAKKREIQPDPKFNDVTVSRFINSLMIGGKRATAERILYGALDSASEKVKEDPLKIFKKAMDNVKPVLEVKSRRVGGANYQVPIEVKPERRRSLASRWLITAARARSENSMIERLATEMAEASQGRGGAMKKREDVHRMAEANKAFAHFRW